MRQHTLSLSAVLFKNVHLQNLCLCIHSVEVSVGTFCFYCTYCIYLLFFFYFPSNGNRTFKAFELTTNSFSNFRAALTHLSVYNDITKLSHTFTFI
uniref:Uncharacterized protein n=1 Tax=Glossina morsitans morsitans TaxID=37546 RepID=A0A1B0FN03_GLOMM